MACLLFLNFILLLCAITLLLLGVTTSRWLILADNNTNTASDAESKGIITDCRRIHRQADTERNLSMNNATDNLNPNDFDDVHVCFNRLLKWYDASMTGPDLDSSQKVLIGISCSCVFVSIIALLLTQSINTNGSFHNFRFSKRMIECLLFADIISVILALLTLALFLGIKGLHTLTVYGFSFWSFVAGTCCIFISCILTAVYRIDVEFEFRRYRHESVATLC